MKRGCIVITKLKFSISLLYVHEIVLYYLKFLYKTNLIFFDFLMPKQRNINIIRHV